MGEKGPGKSSLITIVWCLVSLDFLCENVSLELFMVLVQHSQTLLIEPARRAIRLLFQTQGQGRDIIRDREAHANQSETRKS